MKKTLITLLLVGGLAALLATVLTRPGEAGSTTPGVDRAIAETVTIRTLTDTEWAGMLAGTRLSLFQWPWLPLSPALAFLITILGLNLLAMGLRTYLDPMQSRLRS